MKNLKFLPLVVALALVACGKKEPAATEASAAPAAAPAPAPAAVAPEPVFSTKAPAAVAPAPVFSAETPAAAAAASAAVPPVVSAADAATGEKVYAATCQACHGAGVVGAPKFGDKAAWAPRIAKGKEVLYANALNGIKLMPPKGGNAALKDEELKAAVDYMVSKSS